MREGAEIYDIWLQQDNARSHTSATTTEAIVRLGFTVLPYLAYSLDLAPSNFHLFPKLKETSGAKTPVLIKKSRLQYARDRKRLFLRVEVKNFSRHWQKYIEVGGNYEEN